MCGLMTAKKGSKNSWIVKLSTLWYVVFNLFFLNLLFFEFSDFFFQDTYNTWLKERYDDDPSTHPDLWLEVGSSSGLNRNQVYDLSNTTTEFLCMTYSVSTVGCSQSVPSTQTLEFEVILD
jgi:hypothetical protein